MDRIRQARRLLMAEHARYHHHLRRLHGALPVAARVRNAEVWAYWHAIVQTELKAAIHSHAHIQSLRELLADAKAQGGQS
jgi:hypothetical protein